MKFYKENKNNVYYWNKIKNNKLSCIYCDYIAVDFYKNGKYNNTKNAAINWSNWSNGYKEFYLNNKIYGNQNNFTKSSWRKFVKLKTFL
jgi:hypothetical protein